MNEFQQWIELQRTKDFSDFPEISEEVEKWMGHAFYAGHSKGHLEGYLLGLDESGDGE